PRYTPLWVRDRARIREAGAVAGGDRPVPDRHAHADQRPRALHHVRLPRRRIAASFTFRYPLLQLSTLIPLLSTWGPGRVEQVVRLLDRVPVRGVRWRTELREPEL